MLHFFSVILLFTAFACHEPCKNGYGRAADNLCYRLADEPAAPCGDGQARTDEGECVSVTDASDPYATAGATDGSDQSDTSGGTSGGTSGEDSGDDTDGTAGGETGGAATSAGDGTDGGMGGGVGGGGDIGTAVGGDTSTGFTIQGFLNTSDGSGFVAGDEILIQAWTEETSDPETGLGMVGAAPRATRAASAAVTAVSIRFDLTVTDVLEEGEAIRLTAHLTDDPLDLEGAAVGIYPLDPLTWISVFPGEGIDDIILVIDNGGDVSAPPDGEPVDTGIPPMGGGDPGTPPS